jgi:hypothetical protein
MPRKQRLAKRRLQFLAIPSYLYEYTQYVFNQRSVYKLSFSLSFY